MTEKDKVTVDDIIGIVKTEEQTNSVALKKEAQLSICEKRLIELEKENEQLKKESYGNLDGLNYYQEQNGYLSSKISDLECENEQLKSELKYYKAMVHTDTSR